MSLTCFSHEPSCFPQFVFPLRSSGVIYWKAGPYTAFNPFSLHPVFPSDEGAANKVMHSNGCWPLGYLGHHHQLGKHLNKYNSLSGSWQVLLLPHQQPLAFFFQAYKMHLQCLSCPWTKDTNEHGADNLPNYSMLSRKTQLVAGYGNKDFLKEEKHDGSPPLRRIKNKSSQYF